jgi:hypothetical protein
MIEEHYIKKKFIFTKQALNNIKHFLPQRNYWEDNYNI